MNIDFDWNTMNNGEDPFAKKNEYPIDTRFYSLKKDEKGNGAALIRFLPSEVYENGSMSTIKRVFKYNIKSKVSKQFISEWSPATIGLPDPIQEKWASLWNEGKKEESRRYARSTRYIANIKVLKDPANPDNEGKIFLLDMSETLAQKIKGIIQPSDNDLALGTKPKNLFDPLNGYSFRLIASLGANGFTEYNKSDAVPEKSAIYANIEEAVKDINENAYKLSDWDKPESYKTYDEIKSMLERLDNPVANKSSNDIEDSITLDSIGRTENIANTAASDVPFDLDSNSNSNQKPRVTDNLDDLIKELS